MMDFIFELVAEILLEGSFELSKNKKISKWIRYPLIFFVVSLFSVIILGILALGIIFINQNIYLSCILILFSLIMFVCGIMKFKDVYLNKEKDMNKRG